jgi:hypothetical protein
MSLEAPKGTLDQHGPPAALQQVKQGDHVSVELAIGPDGATGRSSNGETSGSARPAPSPDAGARKHSDTKKFQSGEARSRAP